MTPDMLKAGKSYPGRLPDEDAAIFEFSKEGPELRLFFSGVDDEVANDIVNDITPRHKFPHCTSYSFAVSSGVLQARTTSWIKRSLSMTGVDSVNG